MGQRKPNSGRSGRSASPAGTPSGGGPADAETAPAQGRSLRHLGHLLTVGHDLIDHAVGAWIGYSYGGRVLPSKSSPHKNRVPSSLVESYWCRRSRLLSALSPSTLRTSPALLRFLRRRLPILRSMRSPAAACCSASDKNDEATSDWFSIGCPIERVSLTRYEECRMQSINTHSSSADDHCVSFF